MRGREGAATRIPPELAELEGTVTAVSRRRPAGRHPGQRPEPDPGGW